jgi:hypothetical protein
MKSIIKTVQWFDPAIHLILAIGISILSAFFSFRTVDLDQQTILTFIAFYLILGAMTLLFIFRDKLSNPSTRQLLQFSYFLLGFVLMLTGVLGVMGNGFSMASVFILMLFLPGLAILRAGLHFKKEEI